MKILPSSNLNYSMLRAFNNQSEKVLSLIEKKTAVVALGLIACISLIAFTFWCYPRYFKKNTSNNEEPKPASLPVTNNSTVESPGESQSTRNDAVEQPTTSEVQEPGNKVVETRKVISKGEADALALKIIDTLKDEMSQKQVLSMLNQTGFYLTAPLVMPESFPYAHSYYEDWKKSIVEENKKRKVEILENAKKHLGITENKPQDPEKESQIDFIRHALLLGILENPKEFIDRCEEYAENRSCDPVMMEALAFLKKELLDKP